MFIIKNTLLIFLNLIYFIIFLDVILSLLILFWLKFRPKFINDIAQPLYKSVKKIIPTVIWPFELAPLIILIVIEYLYKILYNYL